MKESCLSLSLLMFLTRRVNKKTGYRFTELYKYLSIYLSVIVYHVFSICHVHALSAWPVTTSEHLQRNDSELSRQRQSVCFPQP